MADKNVSIDITAADRTAAAFASVKRGLGDIDSKIGVLKGTFSAFAALAASAGITDLVKEAVAAASKAQQSSNRLDAVIRATGDTVGYTRGQLDKMAESLSKATTFDDEGIRDAQANLMKFGRLHGETFEHALKLSADYAAFTGGTMVEATQLIGKALADPVNGVTTLGKALGKLSETEQEAIKTAVDHGRIADAQSIIFAKLEKSIGGTAGAMNVGIYGATTAAGKAWDDFLKAIGKTGPIQIVTTGSLNLVAEALNAVTEALIKQNKEFQNNPLYNGGKLQPLPQVQGDPLKALQGSGLTIKDVQNLPTGLRPSLVPPEQNNMTVDEARARGAAARAEQEAAAQARAEAAAALEKKRAEERKKADESFWQMANLKIEANDQWNKSLEETQKITRQLEDIQFAATLRTLEGQEQIELAAATQMEQNLQLRNKEDANKAAHLDAAMKALQVSLLTENEARKFAYEEDFNTLNATLGMKMDAQEQYYTLLGRLVAKNEKQKTAIELEEYKKRHGIQVAYDRVSLESSKYFFGSMTELMQSKSRKMFEIGKVAAIAQTIVSTIASAQDTYWALAKIPIVGPYLGAAAAAAVYAVGFQRVAAIKGTSFNGGGAASGAVGTFSASPNTGLPESPASSGFEQVAPTQQTQQSPRRELFIHLEIVGEGLLNTQQVRSLIDQINEANSDGARIIVN